MTAVHGKKIGELARQYHVGAAALRAWESRYGLFNPHRAANGYRYYTASDELRLHAMQGALSRGMSAADGAALALQRFPHPRSEQVDLRARLSVIDPEMSIGDAPACAVASVARAHDEQLAAQRDALVDAWQDLDEDAAAEILDALWTSTTLDHAIRDVLFPALSLVGALWADGSIGVAAEHVASAQAKMHLSAQIDLHRREHGTCADGPMVWLACPPGELHDLPLVAFALMCRVQKWRVRFLGASTPIGSLRRAPGSYPDAIVLATTSHALLNRAAGLLREITPHAFVGIGGAGMSSMYASATGAVHLSRDIVTEAVELRESVRAWAETAHPGPQRLHRELRAGLSVSA